MGLLDKRNINKAKRLAEKNAAKIAKGVDKATDTVNKKTKGKYADKLQKVDEVANKFAHKSGGTTTETTATPPPPPAPDAGPTDNDPKPEAT